MVKYFAIYIKALSFLLALEHSNIICLSTVSSQSIVIPKSPSKRLDLTVERSVFKVIFWYRVTKKWLLPEFAMSQGNILKHSGKCPQTFRGMLPNIPESVLISSIPCATHENLVLNLPPHSLDSNQKQKDKSLDWYLILNSRNATLLTLHFPGGILHNVVPKLAHLSKGAPHIFAQEFRCC